MVPHPLPVTFPDFYLWLTQTQDDLQEPLAPGLDRQNQPNLLGTIL